ncbi:MULTISPECIES: hypothetical protein [Sphingobium]|jgi:hypothetical protein|uniref:Uncharacterized protein n=1 Tax=Sphingobium yanoikuyae TaxID=13690 RepID=A0A085K2M2_SPHYA|nr:MULTISPECIES: hypothetical protein [Sphingobium]AYO80213.1 hypothetical protein EBF16_27125 [Sphingobium yanoikuyae]KFD26968.1 hypothetical protein IH86_17820 [Sphingobium yanoikuyae]KZC75149.1 hypothetical protein AYR46_22390 [Sphingobium yanoikuyae]MDV3480233.1 hypothetical protein [Sphingobium yanoikuyae]PZU67488.1 MAG: hypothetical protein DI540_10305 [Sphingobium sp.]
MTALVIAKSPDTFADGNHKATIFGNYAYGNAIQGLSLVFDRTAARWVMPNMRMTVPQNS